jgi:hypothetical protein
MLQFFAPGRNFTHTCQRNIKKMNQLLSKLKLFQNLHFFRQKLFEYYRAIGFFNEADRLESSSIMIYSHFRQSL